MQPAEGQHLSLLSCPLRISGRAPCHLAQVPPAHCGRHTLKVRTPVPAQVGPSTGTVALRGENTYPFKPDKIKAAIDPDNCPSSTAAQ